MVAQGLWWLRGCDGSGAVIGSVGLIMVQFEDSLRQRSEVQISIRSSYSEKIFYEKKKFDDLWAHYHGLHSQPSDTYWARLGKKKKKKNQKLLYLLRMTSHTNTISITTILIAVFYFSLITKTKNKIVLLINSTFFVFVSMTSN